MGTSGEKGLISKEGVRWVHDNLHFYVDRLRGSNRVSINETVRYSDTRIDMGKFIYMRLGWDEYGCAKDTCRKKG